MSPLAVGAARRERMRGPVLAAAALTGLVVALHVRDPHQHASWGLCPSALLGLSCPGCGGLRAIHDLTDGNLLAAASSNLLFVASIPLLVVLFARWTRERWRGQRRGLDARGVRVAVGAYAALALVFAVARNLPGSWLAP